MKELSEHTSILELEPEGLVIVAQFKPSHRVVTIKIYERNDFFQNPKPQENQAQITEYSICPSCFTEAISDIRDMYTGWSKINSKLPTKLIGIHNQDHNTLYIQFCLGQRYFIYERSLKFYKETVLEELFGKKHHLRLRAISHEDEQYLISMLRFMPKTKKAIAFYPFKTRYYLNRKHRSLLYSG